LEDTVFRVPTFLEWMGKIWFLVMILDAHSSGRGGGENSVAVKSLSAEFF